MHTVTIHTPIRASAATCFDLARDMGFHVATMAETGERIVGGRSEGLIELGEHVTFEGRHFGMRQRFTSRIEAMDRPTYFRDEMVTGAFASFVHHHRFEDSVDGCVMTDEITFVAPLGLLGRLVGRWVLTRHLERLLRTRAAHIQQAAASTT